MAAGANIDKVKLPDPVSDVPCDKCGAMMVHKMGRSGNYTACTAEGCGYVVRPEKKESR